MKCRICARECPPEAKICRDCAAARKRAFAATVTQPLLAAAGVPSVSRPRFAPRPAKPRPAKPRSANHAADLPPRSEAAIAASAADRKAAPRRLGVQWLLLGLAIVTALIYALLWMLAPDHGQTSVDAAASGDTASRLSVPAVAASAIAPAAPASTPVAPPVDAGTGRVATQSGAGTAPGVKGDLGVALKNASPKAGGRKAAGKIEAAKAPAAEPPLIPAAGPVAAAPNPPPQAAEPPRDPWQPMNEGLSRCAREDWLNRGACEQRLRLQYCPSYWGTVPQCPIGPATDHGQ